MPGDEPILRSLRLEALTEAPEAFTSTYQRELARTPAEWQRWLSPGVILLVEADGMARGMVAGVRDADDAGVVYLMAMWVHPDLRGSGAADALVTEHLAWARAAGATVIRLDVMAVNSRARRLYERHGFRLTGQNAQLADGRLELRMERPLDSVAPGRSGTGDSPAT
jgi:ribosomal protein S18 acetylase RimI-like enzyme